MHIIVASCNDAWVAKSAIQYCTHATVRVAHSYLGFCLHHCRLWLSGETTSPRSISTICTSERMREADLFRTIGFNVAERQTVCVSAGHWSRNLLRIRRTLGHSTKQSISSKANILMEFVRCPICLATKTSYKRPCDLIGHPAMS